MTAMARVTPGRAGVCANTCQNDASPQLLAARPLRSPRIAPRAWPRLRRGLPVGAPSQQQPASQPSRRDVAAAAAVTAGAFQEEGFGASLRRHAQRWLVSPHDKEIAAVALPALVAMLLEPVMNALNAGLVGHLGTQQLSAVSLGTLAVSFVTFLFSFLVFLTVPEIAAAVVRKDADEVSCIAAKSLWIAVVCGFSSAAVLYGSAGAIVGALNPPEPAVAAYAAEYIRIRALGIPAALLGFVATGVFRGFKDTRTPLVGAVASAGVSLGLNVLLLYVLRMGVAGAAVATTAAQLVSAGLLLAALLGGGRVQAAHLTRPPPLRAVLPTLQLGAVLGVRNIISFGMVLYASTLCIRSGSIYQASFEVIRQIWILTIQFFECLNVATQALCATYLGKRDVATARSLLDRLLGLGCGIGLLAGAGVWAAQGPLVGFFTKDPLVVAQAVATLPMICALFPLDAAASIMDGSLLAAKQSNYMSVVQIAGSVVQYGVLAYLAATGNAATLAVWGALKILSFARLVGGAARNYASPKSAYAVPPAPAPAAAAHAATAAAPSPPATGPQTASPAAAHDTPSHAAAAASDGHAAPPLRPATAPHAPQALPQPQHEPSELLRPVAAAVAAEPSALPGPSAAVGSGPAGAQGVDSLSSFEEDVVAMACAACTGATDMHPEMLAMRRRQGGGGAGAEASGGAAMEANGHSSGGGGAEASGGGAVGSGVEVNGHGRGSGGVGAEGGLVVSVQVDLGDGSGVNSGHSSNGVEQSNGDGGHGLDSVGESGERGMGAREAVRVGVGASEGAAGLRVR